MHLLWCFQPISMQLFGHCVLDQGLLPQSFSLFMQTCQWGLNEWSFLEEFILLLEGKSIKKKAYTASNQI